MKITPRQFSQYFVEKGATEECPFCKHEKWSLPALTEEPKDYGDDELMEVAESSIKLSATLPWDEVQIPVVALTCTHCGFVRYQHMSLLSSWMASKGFDK